MFNQKDFEYMGRALDAASEASKNGDIPVGAVVVDKSGIIGYGFNTRERDCDPLGHAEINAIRDACRYKKSKRLSGSVIYVTLEPCPMCVGAILESFISKVYFGAYDPKLGACGSALNLSDYPGICRRVESTGGVLESQCSKVLLDFFKSLRRRDG